ncbi:nuclease-related domain-containing protein [Salicibibacter halophilus]|uniref:nuclease-related domain-containing protein n=1 Tax=Salicibibacter halophilus TaxID=2502791 RepID=UPI001359A193|nr:nuclease-related domain-containing protein [Salicibibacter halophilus]
MIIKERTAPVQIPALEALSRRLPRNHPKQAVIRGDLRKREIGYRGECSLDYYLEQLPDFFKQFRGIRLGSFQIDTLLVSQTCIVIVENKHFAGNIRFEERIQQFTRTLNGQTQSYSHPLPQVRRHQHLLSRWLDERGWATLPIHPLVAFTYPSSVISSEKPQPFIIRAEFLPEKVLSIAENHSAHILTESHLHLLSEQLKLAHKEPEYDPLSSYGIKPSELLTGVHCPRCNHLPMQRTSRSGWHCKRCTRKHLTAHVESLRDYRRLFKPRISNREARMFLHLPSASVTRHCLVNLNLPREGNYKNTRYLLHNL